MSQSRLISFEGVDGAGKTTVLARVAKALRARGHQVFLPRSGKEHDSIPTRKIRELTRSANNLDLCAQAELALYCAREAQVLEELVKPALARGETVLVDRSLLTPLVLGAWGRGLSRELCEAMTRAASGGLTPDITLIFDVHPRTSRMRKRLEKIRNQGREMAPGGRKGLAGSGFKERIREGYLQVASEQGHAVFHAERSTPKQIAARVVSFLLEGVPPSVSEQPQDAKPVWQVNPDLSLQQGLQHVPDPVGLFLTNGLLAGRELRRRCLFEEPQLVAWALDSEDPLLESCWANHPRYALNAWSKRPLASPLDPRLQWVKSNPDAVLASLKHLRCERSERLRAQYCRQAPGAVVVSLVGREDPNALALRRRLWNRASLANRATGLAWCSGEEAWRLREELLLQSPREGLESLRGVTGPRADALIEQYAHKAEKSVLRALSGRSDPFAHTVRAQLVPVGKEVVDSLRGLDDEASWQMREHFAPRYASTVLHSLLGLPDSARLSTLRQHCELLGRGDLHALRRSQALDEQPFVPSWAQPRFAQAQASNLCHSAGVQRSA